MKIDILTLHPAMFSALEQSIIGRAIEQGYLNLSVVDIRQFGRGTYKQVDDSPYGGGAGMVMRPDVVFDAIQSCVTEDSVVVLMDPVGVPFSQNHAKQMSTNTHIVLLCGHYEGIDARIREHYVHQVVSIGDFILTGGELAAMVVVDAVVRLLPGVLGNAESLHHESFEENLLEAPVYTRPYDFQGHTVPDILLSGNHAKIEEYRKEQSLLLTKKNRPDLLNNS